MRHDSSSNLRIFPFAVIISAGKRASEIIILQLAQLSLFILTGSGPAPLQPDIPKFTANRATTTEDLCFRDSFQPRITEISINAPLPINNQPPGAGIEYAPKFSNCLNPISGGW